MSVTTVTPVQRGVAIAILVAAVVASVVRLVTGVPKLLSEGLSASTVLGGVFLLGLAFLILLWVKWIVRLLRGTTARLSIAHGDEVRVEQPGRTFEARGVEPGDVTVESFLSWYWMQIRSSHVSVNGRDIPMNTRVTVLVAGPRSQVEHVVNWVRAGLDPVPAP